MLLILQKYINMQHFKILLLSLFGVSLTLVVNGLNFNSIVYILLIIDFAIMAVSDIESRRIPNVCILVGYGIGLISFILSVFDKIDFYNSSIEPMLGFILIPGLLVVITLIFGTNSIGMGDIKAYSVIGFTVGLSLQFLILFYSLILSILFGLVVVFKKRSIKFSQPMAPYMYLGILLSMILN